MWKQWMIAAALVLVAPAWAATPIDERRALRADGEVAVNNLAGSIEIEVWDRDEVAIGGSLGRDVEALEISGDARRLSVHVRYPRKRSGAVEETLLRLRVPRGASLELEAVSADIHVREIVGALKASSVSGDVFAQVQSPRVRINTVSGDIELKGPAADTELQTVSGDIRAQGQSGRFRAQTVSGDIRLGGGSFGSITADSVSGDVRFEIELQNDATLRVETMSGDVDVRMPAAPDAALSMRTFSGSLRSDFGELGSGRRKLEATLGSGAGRIELNTFSGDVYLGKR